MWLFLPACALVLGTLLPGWALVLLALVALLAAKKWPKQAKVWVALWLLMLASHLWLQVQLSHRLPDALDKTTVTVELLVLESNAQPAVQKVVAKVLNQSSVSNASLPEQRLPQLRKLQLSWYQTEPQLLPGTRLEAEVVLRSPRNFVNGLSFDYQAWLLSQGVDATGYIRTLRQLGLAPASLRTRWLAAIEARSTPEVWPWLAGLVLGEQQAFADEHWQLARRTGTLHLLVVSGLHMGIVLALLLGLWRGLSRGISFALNRTLPGLVWWRLGFLLGCSALYLYLAGSGVALQRAWLMFAALLLLYSTRWRPPWLTTLAIAMTMVLLFNPIAYTSAGFAYSFAAVAVLVLFFEGRKSTKLEALWLPQWLIFLSLLPLFIYHQQPVNPISLLANFTAIPWASLVLLPLCLVALVWPSEWLSALLLNLGERYWQWLAYLDSIPLSTLTYLPWWLLLLWPLWLWLLRSGVNWWLAALLPVWVLVTIWVRPLPPEPFIQLADVGQGQALLISTEHSTVLYDAGPKFGSFDTGELILTPLLHKRNIRRLDLLVISHQDQDHSGGAQALLTHFTVEQLVGGEPLPELERPLVLCQSLGNQWQVLDDNLIYRYLTLSPAAFKRVANNHNNRSCVLQLDWYGQRLLLTGDIDQAVEYELIREYGQGLRSDILLVSHHGSKSSTSQAWLEAVQPREAWISAGFNNKFHHPDAGVIARLEALHIPWFNTAEQGALLLTPKGRKLLNP